MKKTLLILLSSAFGFNLANAQTQATVQEPATPAAISITGVNAAYTQDFNIMDKNGSGFTTMPAGWAFAETGRDNYAGTDGKYSSFAGGSTSSAAGKTAYSCGINASNSNRSFGMVTGGGSSNPDIASVKVGAIFTNNTGVAVTALIITYKGQQWRDGASNTASKLSFAYSVDAETTNLNNGAWTPVGSLDFTSLKTSAAIQVLNGTLSENSSEKSFLIEGLNIPNGAKFWIRWDKNVVADGTANNDCLAIDDFSLTPNPATQPVDLKSFNHKKIGGAIQLNWQTVSELNNDRFELFRSADGTKFDFLAVLSGKGTSNELNNYNYTDYNPLPGTSYYQLKQVDKNGDSNTYPLVVVKMAEIDLNFDVRKTGGNLASLKTYSANSASAVLNIYDIAGKKISSKQLKLSKGYNELSVDLPAINSNIYVFKLSANGSVATKKIALL